MKEFLKRRSLKTTELPRENKTEEGIVKFYEDDPRFNTAKELELQGNYKEALERYQLMLEDNSDEIKARALYKIGLLHKNHQEETKQNLIKAFNYFELAAQKGNGDAMYQLYIIYEEGVAVNKNLKKAASWKSKSQENYRERIVKLDESVILERVERYEFESVLAAIESANIFDQSVCTSNRMALCYQYGIGTNSDLKKAKINYAKYDDYGYNLYKKYQLASETEKNNKSFIEILESSEKKGFARAQYSLAKLLLSLKEQDYAINGENKEYTATLKQIKKNKDKAKSILKELSSNGNFEAEFELINLSKLEETNKLLVALGEKILNKINKSDNYFAHEIDINLLQKCIKITDNEELRTKLGEYRKIQLTIYQAISNSLQESTNKKIQKALEFHQENLHNPLYKAYIYKYGIEIKPNSEKKLEYLEESLKYFKESLLKNSFDLDSKKAELQSSAVQYTRETLKKQINEIYEKIEICGENINKLILTKDLICKEQTKSKSSLEIETKLEIRDQIEQIKEIVTQKIEEKKQEIQQIIDSNKLYERAKKEIREAKNLSNDDKSHFKNKYAFTIELAIAENDLTIEQRNAIKNNPTLINSFEINDVLSIKSDLLYELALCYRDGIGGLEVDKEKYHNLLVKSISCFNPKFNYAEEVQLDHSIVNAINLNPFTSEEEIQKLLNKNPAAAQDFRSQEMEKLLNKNPKAKKELEIFYSKCFAAEKTLEEEITQRVAELSNINLAIEAREEKLKDLKPGLKSAASTSSSNFNLSTTSLNSPLESKRSALRKQEKYHDFVTDLFSGEKYKNEPYSYYIKLKALEPIYSKGTDENLLFLEDVDDFKREFEFKTKEERLEILEAIYEKYIKPDNDYKVSFDFVQKKGYQINISTESVDKFESEMKKIRQSQIVEISVFDSVYSEAVQLGKLSLDYRFSKDMTSYDASNSEFDLQKRIILDSILPELKETAKALDSAIKNYAPIQTIELLKENFLRLTVKSFSQSYLDQIVVDGEDANEVGKNLRIAKSNIAAIFQEDIKKHEYISECLIYFQKIINPSSTRPKMSIQFIKTSQNVIKNVIKNLEESGLDRELKTLHSVLSEIILAHTQVLELQETVNSESEFSPGQIHKTLHFDKLVAARIKILELQESLFKLITPEVFTKIHQKIFEKNELIAILSSNLDILDDTNKDKVLFRNENGEIVRKSSKNQNLEIIKIIDKNFSEKLKNNGIADNLLTEYRESLISYRNSQKKLQNNMIKDFYQETINKIQEKLLKLDLLRNQNSEANIIGLPDVQKELELQALKEIAKIRIKDTYTDEELRKLIKFCKEAGLKDDEIVINLDSKIPPPPPPHKLEIAAENTQSQAETKEASETSQAMEVEIMEDLDFNNLSRNTRGRSSVTFQRTQGIAIPDQDSKVVKHINSPNLALSSSSSSASSSSHNSRLSSSEANQPNPNIRAREATAIKAENYQHK